MITQSNTTRLDTCEDQVRSKVAEPIRARITINVIGLMMLILLCLTSCIMAAVAAARTEVVSLIIDPPDALLPGNVFPADSVCKESGSSCSLNKHCYLPDSPGDDFCSARPSYYVRHNGKAIYVAVGRVSGIVAIVQTQMEAREYTMGDLMLAWGVPTGFIQDNTEISVYWDTRKAYLVTCSFQPESHVESITYYAQPIQAPLWRGFIARKSSAC